MINKFIRILWTVSIVVCFANTEVTAWDIPDEQDLQFPINCPQEFEPERPCRQSSQQIKYDEGVTTSDLYFEILSPTSLRSDITFDQDKGLFTWNAPSSVEDIRVFIKVHDASPISPQSPRNVYVTLKSYRGDIEPNIAKLDSYRLCHKSLEVWRAQNIPGGDAKEEELPPESRPTESGALEATFLSQSGPEVEAMDVLVRKRDLVGFANSTPNGGSYINGDPTLFATDVLTTYISFISAPLGINDKALFNIITGFANQVSEDFLTSYNREHAELRADGHGPSSKQFYRFLFRKFQAHAFTRPLSTWILNEKLVDSKEFNLNPSMEIIPYLQKLKSKKAGATLADIYYLYALSKPEFRALHYYQIENPSLEETNRQDEKQTIQAAGELFIQKTTPSIACNNAAADVALLPISWVALGMNGYEPPGAFLPFVKPWVYNSIGRSKFENPGMWMPAYFIPLFGTALSIADSSLALFEGTNDRGRKLSTFETSLHAISLVADAFIIGGIAKGVSKYTEIGTKLKATSKTIRTEDKARQILVESIVHLKRELKITEQGAEAVQGCASGLAMLSDSAKFPKSEGDISQSAANIFTIFPKIMCETTLDNMKLNPNFFSHAKRMSLDSQLTTMLAQYAFFINSRKTKSLTQIYDDLLFRTKIKDPHRMVISAKCHEEMARKQGKPYINITTGVFVEVGEKKNSGNFAGKALISEDQANHFIATYAVRKTPSAVGVQQGPTQDRMVEMFINAKVGKEAFHGSTAETVGNHASTGDAKILVQNMLQLRNGEIPTMTLTDQKMALDIVKLGTGEDFSALAGTRQEAYKFLLNKYAGQPIRIVMTNENLKKAGAIAADSKEDLSHLPIDLIVYPFQCWHWSPKVQAAFPDAYKQLRTVQKLKMPAPANNP